MFSHFGIRLLSKPSQFPNCAAKKASKRRMFSKWKMGLESYLLSRCALLRHCSVPKWISASLHRPLAALISEKKDASSSPFPPPFDRIAGFTRNLMPHSVISAIRPRSQRPAYSKRRRRIPSRAPAKSCRPRPVPCLFLWPQAYNRCGSDHPLTPSHSRHSRWL